MKTPYIFQSAAIRELEPTVYDATQAPFCLHGLYPVREDGFFVRMPREVAQATSRRVGILYRNTAGARLRFATDSAYLAVGALYPTAELPSARTAALCGAGACCFDLYVDGAHCRVMWHEGVTQSGSAVTFDLADGRYESVVSFGERQMRQITLCFPAFLNVSGLFVGLEPGAKCEAPPPYVNADPVVFYGSSITQGACASRAGNSYPNLLSRKFHFDYLNLGFAGACKAEEPIIDYLCRLPMRLLVYDYDHNAPSVEYLRQTHLPALRKLRAAHPEIPIILLSKPNRHKGYEDAILRRQLIEENCRILQGESDAPIHFVDGQRIFQSHDPEMMTVDNTHPTDLGFYCMAQALEEVFGLYFER